MSLLGIGTTPEGVRTLTIDREEKRNALNRAVLDELLAALYDANADDAVRVVVLRGAGDEAFCAGADLSELLECETVSATRAHFGKIGKVIVAMQEIDKPIVARVSGFALAGGCGLAVAADFTIAGENAVFGLPEIALGLLPLMVSAPILRAVGSRKVLIDLALSGRRVRADEARELGLASRVVPNDKLDASIADLCGELASRSPAALRLGKEALYNLSELDYGRAMDYLREMTVIAARTEDANEGIRAFFEKRNPEWKGR